MVGTWLNSNVALARGYGRNITTGWTPAVTFTAQFRPISDIRCLGSVFAEQPLKIVKEMRSDVIAGDRMYPALQLSKLAGRA